MPHYKNIGNFCVDLDDKLGRGGFGTVYKAVDLITKKDVAAKQIELGNDEEEVKRTKREVEILSSIPPHPNIIEYLGYEIENDELWIFTELCPLKDLDSYCLANSLSDDERFDLMIQISKAIQHVHNLDTPVVHRDIKPENILLIKLDGKLVIKLCDFGVSRIADVTGRFHTMTGTRPFMAPELWKLLMESRDTTYDITVDIFAAALLFLDLIDADKRRLKPVTGILFHLEFT